MQLSKMHAYLLTAGLLHPSGHRFKANVQDPRHSGVNAVHGVPQGKLKGTKMTEGEGRDFVVGLLHKYPEKHPSE
jgi:hypothetical protein